MYRFVLPAILATALAANAAPAETGQLDASLTLFTVMAAINSAGYDADLNSPNNSPLRNAIRQELAKRNIPSLAAIKDFVAAHRRRDPTAELSQYISFALSVGPPPRFLFRQRDTDIPPDVSGLMDLAPLLAAFYKEAGIEELWKRSQPAIDQSIERYHTPVTDAVLQVNLYLRQQTSGFQGRHFQIFIELQAAPNQIQTRSYGNEYTVVITPSPEIKAFEVRHSYLHYSLDPLATRFHEILDRKKPLSDHAMRAPLDDNFKQDFLLLATESLIKAVESRLDQRPDLVGPDLRQGFILTPYFAERLAVYEKQPAAMLVYYPAMVSGIELEKEYARLDTVVFDSHAAPPHTVPVVVAPPPAPVLTGAAKTLDDAEQLYLKRDLEKAKDLYLHVLQETDQKPMHAAAYYGVARIAVLEKDPETAERMFQKTLELDPEPQVKAWTLVYLGRLSMAARDSGQARKYFREALQVAGASDGARKAARQGVELTSQ